MVEDRIFDKLKFIQTNFVQCYYLYTYCKHIECTFYLWISLLYLVHDIEQDMFLVSLQRIHHLILFELTVNLASTTDRSKVIMNDVIQKMNQYGRVLDM